MVIGGLISATLLTLFVLPGALRVVRPGPRRRERIGRTGPESCGMIVRGIATALLLNFACQISPAAAHGGAATAAPHGTPSISISCRRAHYPGGSSGCPCRLLPHSYSLPQMAGGSAAALSLSRPAPGFTHVTAHRIAQPPKATFVTRGQSFPVTRPKPGCRLQINFLLHW